MSVFDQYCSPAVKHILAINVVMFLATLLNENFMIAKFALFMPTSQFFHIWQPITYMFMHGGVWHLFFNMYTLVMFGTALERTIGTKKFLVFYFITGLGAAALHMATQYAMVSAGLQPVLRALLTPTLGASGAIYGILIGYAMFYPESELTLLFPPVTLTAKWLVIIFAGIELFTGVTGTAEGVAHFAHLGGMLFGWLLIRYWRRTGKIWR